MCITHTLKYACYLGVLWVRGCDSARSNSLGLTGDCYNETQEHRHNTRCEHCLEIAQNADELDELGYRIKVRTTLAANLQRGHEPLYLRRQYPRRQTARRGGGIVGRVGRRGFRPYSSRIQDALDGHPHRDDVFLIDRDEERMSLRGGEAMPHDDDPDEFADFIPLQPLLEDDDSDADSDSVPPRFPNRDRDSDEDSDDILEQNIDGGIDRTLQTAG